MLAPLSEDFAEVLRDENTLLVVGSGISMACTSESTRRFASWTGLLESGIGFCESEGRLDRKGAASFRKSLKKTPTLGDLLKIGHEIETRLRDNAHSFARWLNDTVGSLTPTENRDIIVLMGRLGRGLLTTNYDTLLEQGLGHQPATWCNSAGMHAAITNPTRQIPHLHGVHSVPDSIILGTKSYEDLLAKVEVQSVHRGLAVYRLRQQWLKRSRPWPRDGDIPPRLWTLRLSSFPDFA